MAPRALDAPSENPNTIYVTAIANLTGAFYVNSKCPIDYLEAQHKAYEQAALSSFLLGSETHKPSPPATISQYDLSLGTLLYNRVVGVLLEETNKGKNPNMKEFLESEGSSTFRDLMIWVESTGCAQDIHLYDGIYFEPLEIQTINLEINEVVDLTWAFNISKSELQKRIDKCWGIMRALLSGKATILHPTLCEADFALAIVLKIRVLESIKKEKGNTVGVGGMTYFLETKGWETFRSLKDWMLSTGCAQYTHLYSGVKCSISY